MVDVPEGLKLMERGKSAPTKKDATLTKLKKEMRSLLGRAILTEVVRIHARF